VVRIGIAGEVDDEGRVGGGELDRGRSILELWIGGFSPWDSGNRFGVESEEGMGVEVTIVCIVVVLFSITKLMILILIGGLLFRSVLFVFQGFECIIAIVSEPAFDGFSVVGVGDWQFTTYVGHAFFLIALNDRSGKNVVILVAAMGDIHTVVVTVHQ